MGGCLARCAICCAENTGAFNYGVTLKQEHKVKITELVIHNQHMDIIREVAKTVVPTLGDDARNKLVGDRRPLSSRKELPEEIQRHHFSILFAFEKTYENATSDAIEKYGAEIRKQLDADMIEASAQKKIHDAVATFASQVANQEIDRIVAELRPKIRPENINTN